jgi:hypothetical protein
MRGRSVVVGWTSLGIEVDARSPEELVANTHACIAERSRKLPRT